LGDEDVIFSLKIGDNCVQGNLRLDTGIRPAPSLAQHANLVLQLP
jgi:hypothetical protein